MSDQPIKQCRECKEEIPANAKKCSKCGAKQGNWMARHPVWTVVIVLFVIGIISGATSSSKNDSNQTVLSSGVSQSQESTPVQNQSNQNQPKEYQKVTKDELGAALKDNAAAAKDTYNKQYLEVSGKLGTIDSDLSYITIESPTDAFDLQSVHCKIKTQEQKDKVKTLKKGQEITIRGQITDVGEVLGYSMDIDEIL